VQRLIPSLPTAFADVSEVERDEIVIGEDLLAAEILDRPAIPGVFVAVEDNAARRTVAPQKAALQEEAIVRLANDRLAVEDGIEQLGSQRPRSCEMSRGDESARHLHNDVNEENRPQCG
jgi:hypothetical protein